MPGFQRQILECNKEISSSLLVLAQSINYHITMASSCIIYPVFLFLYLVSKASSGSHTELIYLPLKMYCLKYCKAGLQSDPSLLTVCDHFTEQSWALYIQLSQTLVSKTKNDHCQFYFLTNQFQILQ